MNTKVISFDNLYQGEYVIQNLIKTDNNCSAHFEYSRHPGRGIELVVNTYNPKHKTSFFLHSLYGESKVDALEKMYEYIFYLKESLKKEDSQYFNYTVEWYNPKLNRKEKSTFCGKNIQEIVNKFFYGKHRKEDKITIYSIILNPSPCI